MVPSESKVLKLFSPVTIAANQTTTARIDTYGYDYLVVDLTDGDSTTAADVDALAFREDDTAMTAHTALTTSAIAALTGAAAVSSTAGFVLPTASTCTVVPTGSHYRFNIDLKGRKRYLSITYTNEGTAAIACNGTLFRTNTGDKAMSVVAVATNSTEAYQCRLNHSA